MQLSSELSKCCHPVVSMITCLPSTLQGPILKSMLVLCQQRFHLVSLVRFSYFAVTVELEDAHTKSFQFSSLGMEYAILSKEGQGAGRKSDFSRASDSRYSLQQGSTTTTIFGITSMHRLYQGVNIINIINKRTYIGISQHSTCIGNTWEIYYKFKSLSDTC